MIWHSSDIKSVLNELSVDDKSGLANGVVYERLEKYGKNQISDLNKVSYFRRFLTQLNNKSVYALIILSILCFVVSSIYGERFLYSSFLIIAIVIINTALTAYYQTICDKAIFHKQISSVPTCTVIREGVQRIIPSNELTIGDIVILCEGDYICADVRLIETDAFRCNELALTGDIIPVEKDANIILEDIVPVSGRKNMAYAGCNVIHGSAKAVVVETGANTETGKIFKNDEESTGSISAIETKLNSVYNIISVTVVATCALVFFIGMIIGLSSNEPFASMTVKTLLNSVALGICAIPESLPYITILVTALGTGRLIREGIILKNTSTLETMSKTTVLCADKTGVFTCNNMSVKSIFNGDALESGDLSPKSTAVLSLATACSMLDDDVTEAAIELACFKYNNMDKTAIENIYPRLSAIPFDGDRKMMTSINMIEGNPYAIIKGAPEAVIKKCAGIDFEAIEDICSELASKALRLICIALKPLEEIPANPNADDIENDLKFVGIICLEDPPRQEAIESVSVCKNAGIKVVMITGDNMATASAVAKEIGILSGDNGAISGEELEKMDGQELVEAVNTCTVFARISPAQKLKIVETLKKSGEIVTVTGNGLDDADTLSVANVGIAIGNNGNDVARGNADAIVNNNDFSSIVNVFKECYGIISNIKKTILYLLGCNLSELMFYIICLIAFKAPPLLAVQLLWINLLTDAAPAISVSTHPYDGDESIRSEDLVKGKIFNLKSAISILCSAVVLTVCSICAFTIGNISGVSKGYAMAFATISLSQIFHSFNFATNSSIVGIKYKRSKFMIISSIVTAIITVILCSTPAGVVFGLAKLSYKQLLISFILSIIIIPANELLKLLWRKKELSEKKVF